MHLEPDLCWSGRTLDYQQLWSLQYFLVNTSIQFTTAKEMKCMGAWFLILYPPILMASIFGKQGRNVLSSSDVGLNSHQVEKNASVTDYKAGEI